MADMNLRYDTFDEKALDYLNKNLPGDWVKKDEGLYATKELAQAKAEEIMKLSMEKLKIKASGYRTSKPQKAAENCRALVKKEQLLALMRSTPETPQTPEKYYAQRVEVQKDKAISPEEQEAIEQLNKFQKGMKGEENRNWVTGVGEELVILLGGPALSADSPELKKIKSSYEQQFSIPFTLAQGLSARKFYVAVKKTDAIASLKSQAVAPQAKGSRHLESPALPSPLPSRDPNAKVDDNMVEDVRKYLNEKGNYYSSDLPGVGKGPLVQSIEEVAGKYRFDVISEYEWHAPSTIFDVSKEHILGWAQAAKEGKPLRERGYTQS